MNIVTLILSLITLIMIIAITILHDKDREQFKKEKRELREELLNYKKNARSRRMSNIFIYNRQICSTAYRRNKKSANCCNS